MIKVNKMFPGKEVHTFTGGMNKDLDKSLIQPNTYYHAENLRLTSSADGKQSILKNLPGFTYDYLIKDNQYENIVGYCIVRSYLVLFIFNSATNSGYIIRFTFDGDSIIDGSSRTTIYADTDTEDGYKLNWDSSTRIKAVGRYESSDLIKVYWCDGVNLNSFLNISTTNNGSTYYYGTTDGNPYTGSNKYLTPTKLNFIYNAGLFKPSFIETVGGNIQTGIVFYSYQYYKINGAETVYSPLSDKIHLTTADDSIQSNKYYGSDVGENTGKGVRLSIDYNTTLTTQSFDRLRLIRVHYTQANQLPTISIVKEINIEELSGTIYITDNGDSLSELTSEEFSILSTYLFSSWEVTTKNNYLLFGNIEEDIFDVEYDARAYRFRSPTTSTRLYNSDGSYLKFTSSTGTIDGITWSEYDSGGTPTGNTYLTADIPVDYDCINRFNDLTYDNPSTFNSYPNIFKYLSSTYGGTGINISYEFTSSQQIVIDNITTVAGSYNTQHFYVNNSSLNSYSANSNEIYVGYQRDEIYRFGITLFDKKLRPSTVKWIGDLRIPMLNAFANIIEGDYGGSGNNVAFVVGINFTVSNLPSDVAYYQIVRAKRNYEDRTILTQGVVTNTFLNSGSSPNIIYPPSWPFIDYVVLSAIYPTYPIVDGLYTFISPDINYGTYKHYDDSYLEVDFLLDDNGSMTNITNSYGTYDYFKYQNVTSPSTYIDPHTPVPFNDFQIISPDVPTNHVDYSFLGMTYQYRHAAYKTYAFTAGGPAGTCAVFSTDTGGPFSGLNMGGVSTVGHTFLCNIRRINNGQYGGNSYADRAKTEYIECSDIKRSTTSSVDVYRGDTYICYFDHLRSAWHIDSPSGTKLMTVLYLPVETPLNLTLTNGWNINRKNENSQYAFGTRESAGTHAITSSIDYIQEKDYYIYNTVYSEEPTAKIFYAEQQDVNNNTTYDTRVVVSDKKYNNELSDSWTKFRVNNFLDIDSNYGELKDLVNFKNKIFFFQPDGFGLLSIEERSVISDNNAGQLVLGTGGVLDRYDYISSTAGIGSRYGVAIGKKGLYWLDEKRREIYLFNGEENQLSKLKGINSILKSYDTIASSVATFNTNYDEIYFSAYTSGGREDTIVYNELLGSSSSIYTFNPEIFIQLPNRLYSSDARNHYLYAHDYATTYCRFYSTSTTDSNLIILSNSNYPNIKIWDSIEYFSESYDKTSTPNKNKFLDTFSSVRLYNDYQNTDYWDLDSALETDRATKTLNIRRLERNWSFDIPRNAVKYDVEDDSDIFSSSNLDTDVNYRERMRSPFIYTDLTYTNSTNEFSIPYIILRYRESER